MDPAPSVPLIPDRAQIIQLSAKQLIILAWYQFLKQWKPRRRGESYTEAEALVMVTNFLTKAGSSMAVDATMGSGLFEEPSVTMANIAASTGRKRAAPDRLEPSTSLRSQATGSRWKRGKFDCGTDDLLCTDRACIQKRERLQRERDEALALAEEAADQVCALRTELAARAIGRRRQRGRAGWRRCAAAGSTHRARRP